MKSLHLFTSLWALALQPHLSFAYWRMACSVSQTSRIDPILDPGTVSGHAHKFAGGNNVNENSDFNSLLSSTCSSCEIQADTSAYWTPQLYYAHANGEFEEVPNYGMTVYYVGRGGTPANTVPFPRGFKMITGDSRQRSYDNTTLTYLNTRPVADRVSFRCINEANDIPEEHFMFRTDCVNGMRAQINFQSCWDGVNLYLENNAHVEYLSGIDYGECPPSHPVPIPGLFFEVLYMTNLVDQSGGGQFVFSNGDATGYGFHGDFLNGWDMDVHTGAVKNCLYTDDGGLVSACSYLAPSNDVNFARTCPEQPSVLDEAVHGTISALPGCNPITNGPELAPQEVCPAGSNTPGTSTTVPPSSGTSSTITSSPISTSSTIVEIGTTSSQTLTTSSFTVFTSTTSVTEATSNSTEIFSSTEILTSTTLGLPSIPTLSDLSSVVTFSSLTPGTLSSTSAVFAFTRSTIETGFSSSTNLPSTENMATASISSTSLPGTHTLGGIFVTVPTTTSSSSSSITIPADTSVGSEGKSDTPLPTEPSDISTSSQPSRSSANTLSASTASLPVNGLMTITITEWVTMTVTAGNKSPGNFVTLSSAINASITASSTERAFTISDNTITLPGSTVTMPENTITLSLDPDNNGSPIKATEPTVTTMVPVATTMESGTTISLEASTISQPASVLSFGGIFFTITGSTYTTFISVEESTPTGNGMFTITGSTYTTFVSDETGSATTESTSTTTLFTTTTLYVTVTPTSTLTLPTQPTPSGNTTFLTVTSPSNNGISSSGFVSSTLSIDDAFACSLYSDFSVEGCPPPAATPTADVLTAFVTVTQPVTDETTLTVQTTLTASAATADTTVFKIRGREIFFTGR